MPRYEVEFSDGDVIELDARNASHAEALALDNAEDDVTVVSIREIDAEE